MKYCPAQKVYFQVETALSILRDCDTEIAELGLSQTFDKAESVLRNISDEAYRAASEPKEGS